MLFADTDWGAWMVAAGAAGTTVFAAVWTVLKDRRKMAVDEYIVVVNRLEEHVKQLQCGADDCRQREMVLSRAVVYLHGVACNQREALGRAGQETEPLRTLEEFLPPDPRDLELRTRTLQQNSALVREDADRITGKPKK